MVFSNLGNYRFDAQNTYIPRDMDKDWRVEAGYKNHTLMISPHFDILQIIDLPSQCFVQLHPLITGRWGLKIIRVL
jgi:hypothetical protein